MRSYEFFCLSINDEWVKLKEERNNRFTKAEERILKLKQTNHVFKAFRINMTETNVDNNWALTLNAIEIFGFINGCFLISPKYKRFEICGIPFVFILFYKS